MERELLRKVQLLQLEIAQEILRVCRENGLRCFLSDGSCLGAVRHQGFIPWDDDMDMGMLREDYEKFCRIAPEKLKPEYSFQNWYTDPNYGLPFGKVLKRNTLYMENKKSRQLLENGFYVDVFPFDYLPEDPRRRRILSRKLLTLFRIKLMKSGYQPWREEGKILWKKRLGYLYYQFRALFVSGEALSRTYDALATEAAPGDWVCEQYGGADPVSFRVDWLMEPGEYRFEGVSFPGPRDADRYLTAAYGDYMQLPPEDQRENRHQIVELDFGPEQ